MSCDGSAGYTRIGRSRWLLRKADAARDSLFLLERTSMIYEGTFEARFIGTMYKVYRFFAVCYNEYETP